MTSDPGRCPRTAGACSPGESAPNARSGRAQHRGRARGLGNRSRRRHRTGEHYRRVEPASARLIADPALPVVRVGDIAGFAHRIYQIHNTITGPALAVAAAPVRSPDPADLDLSKSIDPIHRPRTDVRRSLLVVHNPFSQLGEERLVSFSVGALGRSGQHIPSRHRGCFALDLR